MTRRAPQVHRFPTEAELRRHRRAYRARIVVDGVLAAAVVAGLLIVTALAAGPVAAR